MDKAAAVCNVLCDEEAWHWDTYDGHKLVFYRDGTGEITSRAELCIWIVAFFEWKVHDPAAVEYNDGPPAQRSFIQNLIGGSPPPLLRASIEFTLTKRRPLLYGRVVQHRINEDVLLDAAFEPRALGITVERGRFSPSWDWGGGMSRSLFRSQLSFDVSPYPALETWRPEQAAMVASMGQPKMTQFCAHLLPDERRGGCVVM
ncbi:hypothetical protein FB451DRAFT_1135290 [Mycena latifolia]|nr:hypothetical protein FB451DRAFT_1135290 [Mycena latifolia]